MAICVMNCMAEKVPGNIGHSRGLWGQGAGLEVG